MSGRLQDGRIVAGIGSPLRSMIRVLRENDPAYPLASFDVLDCIPDLDGASPLVNVQVQVVEIGEVVSGERGPRKTIRVTNPSAVEDEPSVLVLDCVYLW